MNGTLSDEALEQVDAAVTNADYVVLALTDYNPTTYPASEAARRFLDAAPVDLRSKKVVAIAFNAPYHLDATQISKLTAYFGVYSKTPEAIDAAVQALFRQHEPHGSPMVSIPGVGYDLTSALLPDPQQRLSLTLSSPTGDRALQVQTTVINDRQGRPVPDGTPVQFTVAQGSAPATPVRATTFAGVASFVIPIEPGEYRVQAQAGGVTSAFVTGGRAPTPEPVVVQPQAGTEAEAGIGAGAVAETAAGAGAWLWSAPLALATGVAAVLALWARRRRQPEPLLAAGVAPVPAQAALPPGVTVDPATHRVSVEGHEVAPALSLEQYRLIAYLYERSGQVCSRDEVVAHVWPDAHAEGVSEEALDALVRRVRERLTQAGTTRRHLVTVRGHGLRLDP